MHYIDAEFEIREEEVKEKQKEQEEQEKEEKNENKNGIEKSKLSSLNQGGDTSEVNNWKDKERECEGFKYKRSHYSVLQCTIVYYSVL